MEAKDYVDAILARGLTQEQIFEKTGIPQPTISKIKRGDVTDVMSRNYRALQSLHTQLEEAAAQKAAPEVPQPPTVKAKPPFRRAGGAVLSRTLTKQGA